MKSAHYYIIVAIIILIAGYFITLHYKAKANSANTITTTTATDTQTPKSRTPFVVLIVPGHDTTTGGASYKNIYERNLVVDIADSIAEQFKSNPNYKIIVARTKQIWNPPFAQYFADNTQAILDFKDQHQAADKLLISSGKEIVVPDAATHTTASQQAALELYGINKWANDNAVDLVIHIHLNSSQLKNKNEPGTHSGFDMFVPDPQRVNAATSLTIAKDIYDELQKKFSPESDNRPYNSLYTDHGLIALGAANTLTKPAILIEYGYIYEKMLQTEARRTIAIHTMAQQTVAGIEDYVSTLK